MTERLYRDEVGAAVERLQQLEDENARLRAELDRLGTPRRAAEAHPKTIAALMMFLAMGVSAAGVAVRSACPHRTCKNRPHTIVSQRTFKTIDARSRAQSASPELTEIRGGSDCSIPYYYDGSGVKRYKAACIADRWR